MNTMLNHIDTRVILHRYEGSFMVYRPKWNQKQKYPQYPYPTDIRKYEILIIDTQMVSIDYTILVLFVTHQNEVT
jgi:hypothetical protein